MIQFLFQGGHGSHGPRAQALSNLTPGSRCGDIDLTNPSTLAGLDTLTFWGHGDQYKLCGKTPRELHEVIKAWKQFNPGINTVEIITCNARHCTTGDPFTTQLKNGIGRFSSLYGLKIKALPTSVGGKRNAWSILLAETNFNSWCYVTAPGANDALLMQAKSLIDFDPGPRGMISYRGDIATKANKVISANPTRQWTMNYGYFNTLRACLNVV
jgi:hypothetical protein